MDVLYILQIDEVFDEAYLQSFEMNPRLKDEIENQMRNLRNPQIQKQFKDYYFDKDKFKSSVRTQPTLSSSKV